MIGSFVMIVAKDYLKDKGYGSVKNVKILCFVMTVMSWLFLERSVKYLGVYISIINSDGEGQKSIKKWRKNGYWKLIGGI